MYLKASAAFGLFAVLSVASPSKTFAAECAGWTASSPGKIMGFWETATVEDVTACLDEGHKVQEVVSEHGPREFTPLKLALFSGSDTEVVRTLLDEGADPERRGRSGETATHYAAGATAEVMALLLERGADAAVASDNGVTPLHYSAGLNPDPEVSLMLLKAGANVDAQDSNGSTPLHWAVLKENNIKVISAIEDHGMGADLKVEDNEGYTPQEAAQVLGYTDAVYALDPRKGKRTICDMYEGDRAWLAPEQCQEKE